MLLFDFYFILFAILTATFALIAAVRPKSFWLLFIAAAVGASGIIAESYGIFDEMLAGGILIGILVAAAAGEIHFFKKKYDIWEQLHILVFAIMIFYMVFQSFYGAVELESFRKIRWVLYFLVIGLLALAANNKWFTMPSREKMSTVICAAGSVYFAIYLGVGIFFETFLRRIKWDIQNFAWSGTTYAAFPMVIILPAVFFLMKDRLFWRRALGIFTFAVLSLAAFYYDSRISYIAILCSLAVALPFLGYKKFFFALSVFAATASLFICIIWPKNYTLGTYMQVLDESAKFAYDPTHAHDVGRLAHLSIGFPIIKDQMKTFLIGYGFRNSGDLIGPSLAAVYIKKGMPEIADQVKNYRSTLGFTALLVETGMIGILLLVTNFLLTARAIAGRGIFKTKIIFLCSLTLAFSFLLITDPVDELLFYVMIMPGGLLVQLAAAGNELPLKMPKKHDQS